MKIFLPKIHPVEMEDHLNPEPNLHDFGFYRTDRRAVSGGLPIATP